MAANMGDKFTLWLKSIGLLKYSGQFVANGYDDLDLISTMDTEESKSMIETLGIELKGHVDVLKLQKSIAALQNPSTNNSILGEKKPTEKKPTQTKPRQTQITFSGGKFEMKKIECKEDKPWTVFLKPNAKTEKMKYFNSISEEIYNSAYVDKQSQFISYLNGQRQFRWDVKQSFTKLKSVMQSYEEGVIPKEHIFFKKYLRPPVDFGLKDVSFANRTLKHIAATKKTAEDVLELLQKRKVQLFDSQMEVRKWAANEYKVITDFIASITPIQEKLLSYENNVAHTAKILEKKYGSATVSNFEVKRQKKRQKEQKSKNKKKRKITLLRNSRALLTKSNFNEEEIDEICPNIFGTRSTKMISPNDITKTQNIREKKKSMLYLNSIGALSEELVISSDESENTDSEDTDSDNEDK